MDYFGPQAPLPSESLTFGDNASFGRDMREAVEERKISDRQRDLDKFEKEHRDEITGIKNVLLTASKENPYLDTFVLVGLNPKELQQGISNIKLLYFDFSSSRSREYAPIHNDPYNPTFMGIRSELCDFLEAHPQNIEDVLGLTKVSYYTNYIAGHVAMKITF